MMRRSVLAMLGLAPVAGASAAIPQEAVNPVRIAASLASPSWKDSAPEEPDEVEQQLMKLEALQWGMQHGVIHRQQLHTDCPCIESRRATSPAIKALLQTERFNRNRLAYAEEQVRTARLRKLVPPALRGFTWDW